MFLATIETDHREASVKTRVTMSSVIGTVSKRAAKNSDQADKIIRLSEKIREKYEPRPLWRTVFTIQMKADTDDAVKTKLKIPKATVLKTAAPFSFLAISFNIFSLNPEGSLTGGKRARCSTIIYTIEPIYFGARAGLRAKMALL